MSHAFHQFEKMHTLAASRGLKITPISAALLVVADAIEEGFSNGINESLKDRLGHEICIGIRKGLFGARADDEYTIGVALGDFGDTISGANMGDK